MKVFVGFGWLFIVLSSYGQPIVLSQGGDLCMMKTKECYYLQDDEGEAISYSIESNFSSPNMQQSLLSIFSLDKQ